MNVTIINIGDELLLGQVVNTNAATMGRMLVEAGMEVKRTVVVGDVYDDIWQAVDEAMHSSDAVLVTGGLGPTKDDITKKLLCDYFHSELVESPVALENVRRIFAVRGFELTPVNRAQALVPKCCEVLNNDLGTAPCMWFSLTPSPSPVGEGNRVQEPATPLSHGRGVGGEAILVALPGVPFEMEWLMENRVIPRLREHFRTDVIVNKNILVQGIGESFLSDLIEPWELALPENIRLAYLPAAGMLKLRLTCRGEKNASLLTPHSPLLEGLYALAGQYIVGEDCETLSELVHKTLTERGLTLATAESCTGGAIASALTDQAGSSAYFKGSVVAYSNEVKESVLGVKHSTLEAHGAVSEATVREMAEGARQRLGADLAIATSGIAGPGGGTKEKPVGTIWIAVATPSGTEAALLSFPGRRRQQNVERTVNQGFAMLMKTVRSEGK